jgi:hypothetical protein
MPNEACLRSLRLPRNTLVSSVDHGIAGVWGTGRGEGSEKTQQSDRKEDIHMPIMSSFLVVTYKDDTASAAVSITQQHSSTAIPTFYQVQLDLVRNISFHDCHLS